MLINKINIKIHPTFVALIIICVLSGYAARALIVFGLVMLHETCHVLAAKGYGIKVRSIELYPYGGAAVLDGTFEGKRMEETVIAFAGPAVNIAAFFVIQALRWEGILTGEWSLELVKINFWLAAFNMLPVLPLDGGRIVRGFLAGSFGFVKTTKFLAAAGKWLGGAFVVLGFLMQALGYYLYEPALYVVLGIFFWIGSGKELDNARIVFLKQLCRKKEHLLKQGFMSSRCFTTSPETSLNRIINEFSTDHYCLVSVLGKNDNIEKTLSETEVLQGMMDWGLEYKIGKLTSKEKL